MHITPQQIMEKVRTAPPFQREEISEKYKGISVKDWEVYFSSITKLPEDKLRLSFFRKHENFPPFFIFCEVGVRDYPEFQVMEEGHKIFLSGIISGVNYILGIDIIDAKLIFIKEEIPKQPVNIVNSQVHLGVGDIIGRDKIEERPENRNEKEWYEKPIGLIIVGIIIAIVASFLVFHFGWNK